MGEVRGSARIAAALVVMAMLFHRGAAVYRVPTGKWSLPMDNRAISNWVKNTGKFTASYTIYFEFNKTIYNVASITGRPQDYTNCITSNAKPIQTDGVEYTLVGGSNLFFCTIRDYCKRGMRLNITAV